MKQRNSKWFTDKRQGLIWQTQADNNTYMFNTICTQHYLWTVRSFIRYRDILSISDDSNLEMIERWNGLINKKFEKNVKGKMNLIEICFYNLIRRWIVLLNIQIIVSFCFNLREVRARSVRLSHHTLVNKLIYRKTLKITFSLYWFYHAFNMLTSIIIIIWTELFN